MSDCGRILLVGVLSWFAAASATVALAAPAPLIAVMPFRDLDGARPSVGEAIRETMTSDLRELGQVRVLERGAVDRIIAEQKLQAKKTDLDQLASVRVGTLLGANLIVVGGYQRAAGKIRLTARFVRVETGEIVGTAKVDGGESDFLSLQDRVTTELLKSSGLDNRVLAARKRVKVRSFRAVVLYGDAVSTDDEKKRRSFLEQAVAEDPSFTYAARDLEAMQQRMTGYARAAVVKLAADDERLEQQALDARATLASRTEAATRLVQSMSAGLRCHGLQAVAPRLASMPELALRAEFRALSCLRRYDRALAVGERYLKQHPDGPAYREIEGRMHDMAELLKARQARRAEWEADVKDKRKDLEGGRLDVEQQAEFDFAPCVAARWNRQVNELMLDSCSAFAEKYRLASHPDVQEKVLDARFFSVLAIAERGEFARARPLAERVLADSDRWDEELRKEMATWPTD